MKTLASATRHRIVHQERQAISVINTDFEKVVYVFPETLEGLARAILLTADQEVQAADFEVAKHRGDLQLRIAHAAMDLTSQRGNVIQSLIMQIEAQGTLAIQ